MILFSLLATPFMEASALGVVMLILDALLIAYLASFMFFGLKRLHKFIELVIAGTLVLLGLIFFIIKPEVASLMAFIIALFLLWLFIAFIYPLKKEEELGQSDEEAKEELEAEQTLSESLAEAKMTEKNEDVTKKFIADYLSKEYEGKVLVNTRGNLTSTGLPLADTHYVLMGENKKCFTYIYETQGTVVLLLNMSEELAKELAHHHKHVHHSLFPKSKDLWYSVVIDDSFTSNQVKELLDKVLALYLK